jgi:hypothetical protein
MGSMAAIERSRSRSRRPSTVGLLRRQVGYQLKLLVRFPMAAFATIVIPLMVLLAVNLLYSGTYLSSRGGIAYAQGVSEEPCKHGRKDESCPRELRAGSIEKKMFCLSARSEATSNP